MFDLSEAASDAHREGVVRGSVLARRGLYVPKGEKDFGVCLS